MEGEEPDKITVVRTVQFNQLISEARHQENFKHSMATIITGWLFDIYPASHGVTLWFIDVDGNKHCCSRTFAPSFFLRLNNDDQKRAQEMAGRCSAPVSFRQTTRQDLYSGEWWNVLQVSVHDPTRFKKIVRLYEQSFPYDALFTSDILPEQLFLYETDLFALAFGEYRIDERGELESWTLHDSREETEYKLPPLRTMLIRHARSTITIKHQRQLQLEISYNDKTYVMESQTPVEILCSLNWHLSHCDPDIILTEFGDAVLLPRLTGLAAQYRVPLLLNRDADAAYKTTKESSFFQYGKIVHKDGAFEIRGRWHIDINNSFTVNEADLEGVFELVRVTQLCPQRQARASIGTSLSSLQLSWAHRHQILIPAKKREPEEFKSAATLLLADRGGLVYMPPHGYHEDVAELDFVSMYPSIMVNKNVSPETINCRCCDNKRVPELGYTICEKREGIVPATLRSIVTRRSYYKRKKLECKQTHDPRYHIYDSRQNALKWMLVSCFGYLGYKNARFGRIEAHESVNAFSREILLTAKEIAEAHGYKLLHAIVDCMWLNKAGSTIEDYRRLCRVITQHIGIDISLEGIYQWILFPVSKTDNDISTGTRYVGKYQNGETKIRGLESRRHDTTAFVKRMQGAMLEEMMKAESIAGIETLAPRLLEIASEHLTVLRRGKANPLELVIRRRVTKEADEYLNNSISAQVTKLLKESGIRVAPGETIEFIIIDAKGKRSPEKAKSVSLYALEDGYDIEKYTELALDAIASLLQPLGYDYDKLKKMFLPGKHAAAPKKAAIQFALPFKEEAYQFNT
jgi:DNA polymerase-2